MLKKDEKLNLCISYIISIIISILFRIFEMKTKQTPKTKRSISEIFKNCKQAKYIPILKHKIKYCKLLDKKNKRSDNYMTRYLTYLRFFKKYKFKGQKAFEPFHGDGSFKKAFTKNGVIPISEKKSNFWNIIFDKKYSKLPIVSNPPFSFKYQIMHTLLQLKRNFALVLPWQVFHNNTILSKFHEAYGGEYSVFDLKASEQLYISKTKQLKKIGTKILYWKF